ncbi:DctP family TRAP transporter solute-binding subunit [Pseudomonas sp. EpS/L25]|uniref:DctP family TRAP transporter solute-binding subunit n=1 Tax=Pseudomonas sp. EpS/L25 TaxID=1749078 RepID=UPI00074431CC|nr:DctP family TRAP transporter solute-binding subunit [Pseudomonas sp. EpS/L25]KUM44596.1 C4-dicarboxylate ABC transporter [Pseudomonas sp. EpS/L25]
MTKRFFATLAAVLLGGAAWPVLADPVVIKFAHVVNDDTPKGRGALQFQKLVQERLGGQVKIEVYPNSTLVGDADELEALKANKVQLLAPSVSKLNGLAKGLQVYDLPYLFDNLEAVKRFQRRDKSRELLGSLVAHGITGLGYWNNGGRQLSATRDIRTPADLKGLAFRVESSDVLAAYFQQLGAQAVKLPFAQVYGALQSGKVQGAENPWSNLLGQKLNTVQPYIVEDNHSFLTYMVITNTNFWNGLPFGIRAELEAILDEVTLSVNRDAEAINAKARERVVAANTSKILVQTPAEREAWRAAVAPLIKRYESEVGSDVLRAAEATNRR